MNNRELDSAKKDVQRASQAEQILSNEMYREAMILIEMDLINQLRASKFEEAELREDIHKKLQVCQWFEKALKKTMINGKVASEKMGTWEKLKQQSKKMRGM